MTEAMAKEQQAALYASEQRSDSMTDALLQRDVQAEFHLRAEADGVSERVIEGIVVPFGVASVVADRDAQGVVGRPYREMIARGATEGLDPSRVKLESTVHGGMLVGRGIDAKALDEGLFMALRVAKTPAGDELLELAREGVLTDMSVVFRPISERRTSEGVVERTAIDIRRVAVLERGAYQGAQVTAVRADPDPPPRAAAPAPKDPPKGGSSDLRSTTVEYITREEKASRVTELKASLGALAVEHPGVLPDEAQVSWDADTKELESLERDIKAWDDRKALLARYAGEETKVEREVPAVIVRRTEEDIFDIPAITRSARTPEERDQKYRDNAMRAIEQMRFPLERFAKADQDGARGWIAQLVDYSDSEDKELALRVLATGSPQYRRAFNRYVASGGSERAAALAVGVDGTGGYSVPVAFDPTIIATGAHTFINPFRSACRSVTIVGTDTWQALTANAITAAYAAEAAAATEQGPTFTRPEYIVKRAHAFVTASYEMAQDRADLPSELAVLFGEARDTLEENQFAVGVGTTVFPQGMLLDGAFTAVETIGNNVLADDDIDAQEAALPIRHRANGAWFLNRKVIREIQGFETAGGKYFGGTNYPAVGTPQQNPGGNTGLRLLGYPVWETPSASSLTTTSAAIVAVFCDPRNYIIVDRVGMSVKVIPDMLNGATPSFPTGEIGIYAFWRNTARVVNVDGGRQIKVNAP